MVGGARAALARILAAAAGAMLVASAPAASAALSAKGGCRDARAQGPYQLRGESGQLRVAGAFNEGTRTGSFIFWRDDGVREAHVPYDNGLRNGTVATWYDGPADREPQPHVESQWRAGVRDGVTRSWYADGHRRSEIDYAHGRMVVSRGWTEAGRRLSDAAARARAEADEQDEDAEYRRRSDLIADHMPACGGS